MKASANLYISSNNWTNKWTLNLFIFLTSTLSFSKKWRRTPFLCSSASLDFTCLHSGKVLDVAMTEKTFWLHREELGMRGHEELWPITSFRDRERYLYLQWSKSRCETEVGGSFPPHTASLTVKCTVCSVVSADLPLLYVRSHNTHSIMVVSVIRRDGNVSHAFRGLTEQKVAGMQSDRENNRRQ